MSRRTEEWRDIPGYDGWYQISDWGHVQSFHSPGGNTGERLEHPNRMNPRIYRGVMTVWLRDSGGTTHRHNVAKLVVDVWMGGVPAGGVIRPRDGNPQNTCRWNLKIISRSEFSKSIDGFSRRKFPVLKIDTSLQIIDAYQSAMQAEKKNHFAKKVLADYCNLKRATVIAGDGFIYAWDDEKWLRKTMARAIRELDAIGARYTKPDTEEYWNLPIETEMEPPPAGFMWAEALPLCGGADGT